MGWRSPCLAGFSATPVGWPAGEPPYPRTGNKKGTVTLFIHEGRFGCSSKECAAYIHTHTDTHTNRQHGLNE